MDKSPPVYGKASLYIFKKKFSVSDSAKSFVIRISAETRYRLYINDKELCHGPCKSTKFVKHYEELDCIDALNAGENEIRVVVLYISPQEGNGFSTTCPNGMIASASPNMWVQVLHISAVYFINLIREYLRFTGDVGFVKSLVGIINKYCFDKERGLYDEYALLHSWHNGIIW